MKKIILVLGVILVLTIVLALPKYKVHFNKYTGEKVEVFIKTGSGIDGIGSQLVSNNVFESISEFKSYANEFGYNSSNIEPGKYVIDSQVKFKHIIYGLKNGNNEYNKTNLVFTYSRSIPSMIQKVAPFIEADSAALVDYILSDSVIKKYGFTEETIISLFLPDTYEIGEWDISPEEFVSFMAKKYKEFWNENRKAQAKKLKLSQSQVSTLTSIVMSEQSRLENEWPIIAGLYINRLNKGMFLESDPTFKFCWGDKLDGVQRLLFEHRKIDCPYNTYLYGGLPPGPIMLVSKKGIDAVLNYKKHDYIFMCAKGDGTSEHNFASNYLKHLKNAAIYRRNQFNSN